MGVFKPRITPLKTLLYLLFFLSVYLVYKSLVTKSVDRTNINQSDNLDPMFEVDLLIEKTWNNEKIDHEPIKINLRREKNFKNTVVDNKKEDALVIRISGPYFNSPEKPPNKIGEFFSLWEYEVVEIFFLAESGRYLELQFGPHGHYIVILLYKFYEVAQRQLEIDYVSFVNKDYWVGEARIPDSYFPRNVTKMNAYAMHGDKDNRKKESLYPVMNNEIPAQDPHNLKFFKEIDFKRLMPSNWKNPKESKHWKK